MPQYTEPHVPQAAGPGAKLPGVKKSASPATSAVIDQAQSQASAVTDHAQQARSTVTDQAGPGGQPRPDDRPGMTRNGQEQDARWIGAALRQSGRTLAIAESLTGGLLASAFARTSGSSDWFRGAIVAYASSVKYDLLDVPDGPVISESTAAAMASGAARLFKADLAMAVTGVGGPDPQDGEPPGTVWVATWPGELGDAVLLRLRGSPESICDQVCAKAVRLLRERLAGPPA